MQDITDISANESDSETYTSKTQAKGKRKAEKMPKSQRLPRSPVLQKRHGPNEEKGQKEAQEVLHSAVLGNKPETTRSSRQPKAGRNNGVENAVKKAQEKARREIEEKDAMWSRIAKAVDNAIEAKASGSVEAYQVEHIVNAILECALPKPRLNDKTPKEGQKPMDPKAKQQTSQISALDAATELPKKQESWAVVASQNKGNVLSKPSLTQPLRGTRPDARLMIRLGPESPHREEHPFVLQKKANIGLPANIVIGRVAHVQSGLALMPAPGITIAQLEEYSESLARCFGSCRAEKNEKWAKYLVKNVPLKIRSINEMIEVTPTIAAEAFEQSCNMKLEWARWLIPQGMMEEELVEASMIFAVRPGNIHTVSKVISLLGAMHVIVALSPRKTCVQCTQCGEWSHKQENCAKRSRCFHYSSEKHSFDAHVCLEDKCSDGDQPCPHPPKCIVCAGLHKTDYENCPLKPKNAKTKGATKRPDGPEIARIRGQQKALRD